MVDGVRGNLCHESRRVCEHDTYGEAVQERREYYVRKKSLWTEQTETMKHRGQQKTLGYEGLESEEI
jgi:hypothetical protein